jgi:serine/threonine protein kinase
MALRKPIKIGKYEVVGLLGKGGMGVVYKANDPLLGRAVAIKMMTTLDYVDNPELLQRFYREAQSTGSLHHRNIVTVYELGDHEGSPYLVMEYLEGETLDALISSKRPLPLLDKINFIIEVCDGLSYAHERSVVHRDIKPGNIMVLKDRGVKIVDFGIAHIGNRTVTRTGQLLGSLPYMSPEQISGKQVDARTDIFSLGVVFYQLLTSRLPFEGETPAATLLKIIQDQPRPITETDPTFPPELDEILLRALAKDREERYSGAQDLAYDLAQIRARIQQEIIEERLNEAELLLSREELLQAREKLTEVLRIDRHNTRAMELSRATQQRIQQQELGEQVRQLRSQAEEAYQKEQFSLALDLIQKAVSLHATDPDLQRLRSSVQEAKTRSEKLQRAVARAESAYEQGELDSAKQAIEEALELAPDDVHAKSLHRIIERDWTQRVQRLQILGLIEEARKEFASRNFTLAIEVLRKAEAIDPATPELQTLMETAKAARQQERRRKELETIKQEIEGDLDRDDYQLALTRADTALQEFPDDRGLQKLRELAQKQRILAEKKSFVRDQISRARKLLETGGTKEALEVLQSSRDQVGTDPQLDSLMVVVRETLERQQLEARKQDYLRRAKDHLRAKQYAEAIQVLQAAQSELGSNPEVEDLLQFTLEQQNTERRRQMADAAAERAQAFVRDQDYEKAVQVLEEALEQVPDEELRIILVQARHAAADHRKLLEDALSNTESMLEGQRPIEALRYLQSQPQSFSRDARFVALLQKATEQSARLQKIEPFLEKARAFLARDEFDSGRSALEECLHQYGRTPDLNKLLADIEERQAQVAAERVENALRDSREWLAKGKPEQALQALATVQPLAAKAAKKLSSAWQALQLEAANALARRYKSDIDLFLAQGSHSEAASLLQRAQAEFPQTRDVQQAAKSLDQAVQRRQDCRKVLADAENRFSSRAWREGGDLCLRAGPLSTRDPIARQELLSLLERAASEAADHAWHHADYLLQCISQIQPSITGPAVVQAKVAAGKRDESIREILAAAKRWENQGDIEHALEVVGTGLKEYPSEARLLEQQRKLAIVLDEKKGFAQQEKQRKEKESFLAEVQRRVRDETTAGGRRQIFEEALRRYPDEPVLKSGLSEALELERRVASLALNARSCEETQNYDEAIRNWTQVTSLGVSRSDADAALARLKQLQEQARATARSNSVGKIRDAVNAFDLNTAASLLADAQREYTNDSELAEVASALSQITKARQDNLALLSEAQRESSSQHWQRGSDLIVRSVQQAGGDPAVLRAALQTALAASKSALAADVGASELLLEQAARIQPDAKEIPPLRKQIEQRQRELAVQQSVNNTQNALQAGDRQRALAELDSASARFPDEPRLVALRNNIESSLALEKKAHEEEKRLLEIVEASEALRSRGDLPGAQQKVSQGLQLFPNNGQLLELKRGLEKAAQEIEKQNQREKKQRAAEEEERRRTERAQLKKQEAEARKAQSAKAAAQRASTAPNQQATSKSLPLWVYSAIAAVVILIVAPVVWISSHTAKPSLDMTIAVQIHTSPEGATIRSSDTGESCVSPNCTLKLPAGVHEFHAELPGYEPLTKSVSVDSTNTEPLVLTLVPQPPPPVTEEAAATSQTAHLNLRDAQPGSEVLLDNKRVGRIGRKGTFATDVPPGNHQIGLLQRNQQAALIERGFSNGSSVDLSGTDFHKQPSAASEHANGEQIEWQKLQNSQDMQAIQGFLNRYPNGSETSEAQNKLEDLYWAKASGGGTNAGYTQYLEHYPNGRYAQQAHGAIADMDWHALENSGDTNALQSFLKKYPAGNDHDKAAARLDDLSWQHTDQKDLASIRSYVSSFPDGRHSPEAHKRIDDLTKVASTPRPAESRTTTSATADDNKGVLEIVKRYQKAYESRDVQQLQQIWPGMTGVQIKSLGDFFRQTSTLSLQYEVSQVEINGDSATVRFTQALRYAVDGKSGKNSAKIVMQLTRAQGESWQINSIR